jgi:hypothetical protein
MPIWHLRIVHVARCSQMTIVRTQIASDMAAAADRCAKALAVRQSACGHGLLQLQRDMASTKHGGNPAGA